MLMRKRSPFRNALRFCLVNRIAYDKHSPLYSILSKGSSIDAFGFSDLHIAVLNLDSSICFEARLALTSREAVDEPDYTGRTALSWAAELGEYDRIKMLLMKDADPNIADVRGKSPFFWCASRLDCLTALLEAGAHINQVKKMSSMTKLVALIRSPHSYEEIDRLETMWRYGACLTRPLGMESDVIHWCVSYYRPKSLKWLLEKPIDWEARTANGLTPLLHFLTCDMGKHLDLLEMLLNR